MARKISVYLLFLIFISLPLIIVYGYNSPDFHQGVVQCGECHSPAYTGKYDITTPTGNVNLCLSCHTGGQRASNLALYQIEQASITAEGKIKGFSHRYDANVDQADISAMPEGELVDPLGGKLKSLSQKVTGKRIVCSACHNRLTHNIIRDEKKRDKKLCRDCHRVRKQATKTYTGKKQNHPVSEKVNCSSCHSTHVFQ